MFTVSIIGKPNVGKSSLFNRLSGGKYAITGSTPGLTRDRKEIVVDYLGFPFRIVDTAGFDVSSEKQESDIIMNQKMIY